MLARLGLLQIDSVNALVRSHYLPLFSRLGPYSMTLLDEAAWSVGRHRQLFEYWGHEASLLPLEHYPLMRWRMRQAADGQGIYQQLARFGREQQPLIRQVLQAVREQGALGARQPEHAAGAGRSLVGLERGKACAGMAVRRRRADGGRTARLRAAL